MQKTLRTIRPHREAGATLYILAGAMVVLLGISALAIDLVVFYVVRNEAQRAADAAALAGANYFAQSGCTNGTGGCISGGPQEVPAAAQARAVAAQNSVGGQAPTVGTVDVNFNYPDAMEPQVIVTVHRDSAKGNAMPTFFGKILGVATTDISATAVAEAYNGPNAGATNLRPFLVPNCDPIHWASSATATNANAFCACVVNGTNNCPGAPNGAYMSYYVYPSDSCPNCGNCPAGGCKQGGLVNRGVYDPSNPLTSGVVGQPWTLHDNAGPSQWFTIAFTGQSGKDYETNIYAGAPKAVACNNPLNSLNGNKVGPTTQGVETLIHADGYGMNQGQDSLCSPTTSPACTNTPFTATGGAKNPYGLAGQQFFPSAGNSDSVMTVALFQPDSASFTCNSSGCTGSMLSSGGSTVYLSGYMQLFVNDINKNGGEDIIDATVLSVTGCGALSGGTTTPVVNGGPIPIRLIRQ